MLFRLSLATLLLSVVMAAGCKKSMETSPDSSSPESTGPETTATAQDPSQSVEELKAVCEELATAYGAGDIKTVDGIYHGKLGSSITGIKAAINGLEEGEKLEEGKAAFDGVMTILSGLHPPHGEGAKIDPADFEAEKENLDLALETLEQFVQSM